MLGVSRGTLRTALDRLEESGEITRRQGAGTYVGTRGPADGFHEGLEVLRPVLRAGRAPRRRAERCATSRSPTRGSAPRSPRCSGSTRRRRRARSRARSLADGEPVALMRDVVRPGVALPAGARARARDGGGRDGARRAARHGVPVASAVTTVRPQLITGRERVGRALGVDGTTAVLELEEVMHLTSGEAVQHSSDVFAPGGIDLQVRRDLEWRRSRRSCAPSGAASARRRAPALRGRRRAGRRRAWRAQRAGAGARTHRSVGAQSRDPPMPVERLCRPSPATAITRLPTERPTHMLNTETLALDAVTSRRRSPATSSPRATRLRPRAPRLEPRGRPAPGAGRASRPTPPTCVAHRRTSPARRPARRAPGHRPQRGPLPRSTTRSCVTTQRMRGVEIDAERRIARVAAGTLWLEVTEAGPARPRPAVGLLARRRRRRLHARRRPQLARAQARPRGQQRHRDRARDRRRRAACAPTAEQRRRPVLGAARRRRQLRRRDRDRVPPVPDARRSTRA